MNNITLGHMDIDIHIAPDATFMVGESVATIYPNNITVEIWSHDQNYRKCIPLKDLIQTYINIDLSLPDVELYELNSENNYV